MRLTNEREEGEGVEGIGRGLVNEQVRNGIKSGKKNVVETIEEEWTLCVCLHSCFDSGRPQYYASRVWLLMITSCIV